LKNNSINITFPKKYEIFLLGGVILEHMKKMAEKWVIALLILLSISINIYFTATATTFQNDESYYVKRQVEEIQKTGLPLYDDELSYSGRTMMFPPGYYYLMASLTILFPEKIIFNLVPAILASLSIIVVYAISKKLTNSKNVAYFSGFISIFIPIYALRTTNTISQHSLIIPLSLICLYLFCKAEESNKKPVVWYIITLCLLSITTGYVFIILCTILVYALMLKVENMKLDKIKKELLIFSLFFITWIQFLIYKKALLLHGPSIIWQNIPLELIKNYFAEINILTVIYYTGIVPFFCALYIIYKYSFKIKNEKIYLFIAFTTVISTLLVLRLIKLQIGLIYLGFCFVIFFSVFYKELLTYINKTKVSKYKKHIITGILIIFLFTSIIPSIAILKNKKNISEDTISALDWINNNTRNDSVILGTISEGMLINQVAKRKNIIDNNFLMIKDINERVKDLRIIYTSSSLVKAIELLDYYNVDYILIDGARREYGIFDLKYAESECFNKVYDKEILIYKVVCRVETNV